MCERERGPEPASGEPSSFNTSVANMARVYNYWLGGKDNFAADRAAADQAIAANPAILRDVRVNRRYLARAVRYLTADCGIRQFLDIGTGIPLRTTPMRSPSRPLRPAGSSTRTTSALGTHLGIVRWARPIRRSRPAGHPAHSYLRGTDARLQPPGSGHAAGDPAPDPRRGRARRHRRHADGCYAARQLPRAQSSRGQHPGRAGRGDGQVRQRAARGTMRDRVRSSASSAACH